MSQQGRLRDVASALETLTGDTGGIVLPDGAGNIDILGGDTTTVTGNPGAFSLTIDAATGGYPITPYVVGPAGQAGYATIQAAVDAATLAGGTNMIWVQPGTYTENLNITSSLTLMSVDGIATIDGLHTPPSTGDVTFDGFILISATHILDSSAVGTTTFNINNSFIIITNGYVFNIPNWTGDILMDNCGENSTNDGVINNVTGSSDVKMINVEMGAGSGQTMELNGGGGFLRFDTCNINCPVNMLGSGDIIFQNGVKFANTVTIGGSLTGFAIDTNFRAGSNQALVFDTSGNLTISNGEIDSTNDPAIGGTGMGTLTLTSIAFPNNANIGASVTVGGGINSSGTFNTIDQADGLTITSDNITADGTSTDIDITITPKGTGAAIVPTFLTVGTTVGSSFHTLEVQGHVGVIQAATATDQHAMEITADAANFADFKALDITYDTGSIAAGDFQAVILVNVDETASTGGQNIAFNVDTTTEGSATIIGLKTGIGINAIHQETGTFGNIDEILNIAVDVTAALASGGAGNISGFVADNDTFTFGDAAQWDELEIILTTGASGGGIAPTFEFSTGGTGFTSFGPIDGTNGFRNTGVIDWESADLAGWVTNDSGRFEIRVTRTRNSLTTTPILDECQLTSETEHTWDSNGDVNINSLTLVSPLTVPNGGTGVATLTDGGILLGSGTGAITVTAQPASGELLIGSVGADPVLATLTAGTGITITEGAGSITIAANDGGMSWTEVTGTTAALLVDNGFIANNAGLVTLTLPATGAVGDVIKVDGKGAGGWLIAQNASQTVHFLAQTTTTGVGGSLASTTQFDCVTYRCITANAQWLVESAVGNLTVV